MSPEEAAAASLPKVSEAFAPVAGPSTSASSSNAPTVPVPAANATQTDVALLADSLAPDTGAANGGVDQLVTPWDVEGAVVDGKQLGIDYDKLITSFGTKAIDAELLARFEKLTGHRPHLLLRRGMFFSHR